MLYLILLCIGIAADGGLRVDDVEEWYRSGSGRRAHTVRFPHGQGLRATGHTSGHAEYSVQAQRRG